MSRLQHIVRRCSLAARRRGADRAGTAAGATSGRLRARQFLAALLGAGLLAPAFVAATAFPAFAVGNKLVFTTAPGGEVDGEGWTAPAAPIISLETSTGSVVTTDSSTQISLSVASGPTNFGPLVCTGGPVIAVAGVVDFANDGCSITGAVGTNYKLTASVSSGSTYSAVTSGNMALALGPPSQLIWDAEPASTATDGATLSPAPKVWVEDAGNNVVTSGNGASDSITLTVTPTTAALACTSGTTLTAAAGKTSFTGCSITGAAGSGYALAATDGTNTVSSPTPDSISISTGAVTQLVFTGGPSSETDGVAFSAQPTVQAEDVGGNVVTSYATSVTLSLSAGTGTLTCSGGLSAAPLSGVATFSGCQVVGTPGNFTLKAKGGTLIANSDFTLAIGAPSQLAFTLQPGGTTDGLTWTAPQVSVEDVGGNVETANNSTAISIDLTASPLNGGPLTCTGGTTATVVNGVATFNGCSITGATGSYTLTATGGGYTASTSTFTLAVGTASQLVFTVQPGGGTDGTAWAAGSQPKVAIEDVGNNVVTTIAATQITLTIGSPTGAGTLTCTPKNTASGVATFTGCSITGTAGSYTLVANGGGLPATTSNPFSISTGAVTQLVFTGGPSSETDGVAFSAQPTVQAEDVGGNVVTSYATSVTLSLSAGTGTLTCSGGLSAAPLSGVATFSGCQVVGTPGNFTLKAKGGTLIANSDFTLAIGAPSQLAFTLQPGGTTDGLTWTAPQVSVEDVGGNVETANNSTAISIDLTASPLNGGPLTCTGGTTATVVNGVATFNGCSITGATGSYTLTATGGGYTASTSTFTLAVGTASQLVFTVQPGGGTDGTAWAAGSQPKVAIEDVGNNVVTTIAATQITLTIGSPTGAGTLTCTPKNTASGVATFTGCSITGTAGSYTLVANGGGLPATTSNPFSISTGAVTQLVFTGGPSSETDGVAFSAQPTVQAEDVGGNVVTSYATSVTLSLSAGTGTLTCSGGLSAAPLSGVATFSGCQVVGTPGNFTLKAKGGTLIANSDFTLAIGAPSQLAFTLQPGGTTDGLTWTAPQVSVEDVGGNVETANNSTAISIDLTASPLNGGPLTCTGGTTATVVNGVATFNGCSITGATGSYTLTATGGGYTASTSTFTLAVGTASQLVFTVQPGGGTDGTAWAAGSQPKVAIEDVGNNVVTTIAATQITLTIGSPTGAGTLTCTPKNTASGVATFTGCSITGTAGSYTLVANGGGLPATTSNPFSISTGAVTQLVFTGGPSSETDGVAFSAQPTVQAEDVGGNVVTSYATSVTLSLSAGTGTLTCSGGLSAAPLSGVATFSGCQVVGTPGNFTLKAKGGTLIANSDFTLAIGAPSQLAFTLQPGGTTDGLTWTAPQVSVEDVGGNVETANNSTAISIDLTASPLNGGPLTCTGGTTATVVNGVATFNGCSITGATGSYTLTATGGGYTASTSTFTLAVGTASQLVFTVQPGGGTDGTAWAAGSQPKVAIEDVGNNVVTTIAATQITLTIGSPTGAGTLTCTPKNTASGVATFTGCSITGTAGSYTLVANGGGLPATTSNPFSISTGAVTQLVFTGGPSSETDGVAFSAQPTVQAEDVGGNVVTSYATSVTLSLSAGTGTLTCSGGLSAAPLSGVATFSGCQVVGTPGNFTLKAKGGTLIANSDFTLAIGAPSQLAFTLQPGGTTDGLTWTAPQVSVEDIGGNVETANNSTAISIDLTASPLNGGPLTCTGGTTATVVNGVATFNGCSITGATGSYTLTATGGGYTASTSTFTLAVGTASQLVFTVQPGGGTDGTAWAAGSQPKVAIEDVGNNVVTTIAATQITLTIGSPTGAGTLTCTPKNTASGVATFTGCSITGTAGSYTLVANGGGLPATTSNPFSISTGAVTQLVFTGGPSSETDGVAFSAQPTVQAEDVGGNVVTSYATSVTLSLSAGTGTLTCSGGLSAAPLSGVATFSGCQVVGTPGNFTLKAKGGTLIANSDFTLAIGAPSQLAFTLQPGGTTDGLTWTAPQVSVEDIGGNVETANNSTAISIDLTASPLNGGPLTCTGGTTATVVNGVATFNGCSITGATGSYTLTATGGGYTASTSTFTLAVGTASQLVFTSALLDAPANMTPVDGPLTIGLEDVGGNVATTATDLVLTLTSSSPEGLFALSSGGSTVTTATITPGNSSVAIYYGDPSVGTPLLVFTASGFDPISETVSLFPAAASALAIEGSASGSVEGALSITVQVTDAYGNAVSAPGLPVTLGATAPGQLGGVLAATTNANGVATFNAFYSLGSGTVWLVASSTGLSDSSPAMASVAAIVPDPPASVQAMTSGSGTTVSVTWSIPFAGGSPITGYLVTPNDITTGTVGAALAVGAGSTAATFTGLTAGDAYEFSVVAVNAVGSGRPSGLSNAVEPVLTSPVATVTATSTTPSATVTAAVGTAGSSGSISVAATGIGSFTVAQYASPPVPAATAAATYYDVSVSPGSSFTQVSFSICGVAPGGTVTWQDPVGQRFVTASEQSANGECVTVTVTDQTTPSISDLYGSVFAVQLASQLPEPALTLSPTLRVVVTHGRQAVYGTPVTYRASVHAGSAAVSVGQVTFRVGTTVLCVASVKYGVAACVSRRAPRAGALVLEGDYANPASGSHQRDRAPLIVARAPVRLVVERFGGDAPKFVVRVLTEASRLPRGSLLVGEAGKTFAVHLQRGLGSFGVLGAGARISYRPGRDFAPIAGTFRFEDVLFVNSGGGVPRS